MTSPTINSNSPATSPNPMPKRKRRPTWQPAEQFRVIKLPPAGPKPGQSQESFLRGKARGDRQWDRTREANFGKLF